MQNRKIRDITLEETKGAPGNCYVRAFNLMAGLTETDQKQAKLVHGRIVGVVGELKDVRFYHAWVEIGELVYQLHKYKKKPTIMQKIIYYEYYLPSDMKKYS